MDAELDAILRRSWPAGDTHAFHSNSGTDGPAGSVAAASSPWVNRLKLFASNDELAVLESRLATLSGPQRCAALLPLAWQLRQRDSRRALVLADEADALLPASGSSQPELTRAAARLRLLRAEIRLLFDDPAAAEQLAQSALRGFESLNDGIGVGDTRWLEASIALELGQTERLYASIQAASDEFRRAGDLERREAAQARQLVYAAFRDPVATAATLQQSFPEAVMLPESVLAWLASARANAVGFMGDPGMSIKHDLQAYHAARDSGQIRQALVAVTNGAETIATMGDLNTAMDWIERALALARSTEWPAMVGLCLRQLGDVLRQLSRHDEALVYLQEARSLVQAQPGARNHEMVLVNLGQLALDRGQFAEALLTFEQLEESVRAHGEPDLLMRSWRGQSSALMHLGRRREASAKALAALALAREQGSGDEQIQMLRVLAQLETPADRVPLGAVTEGAGALHFLLEALGIAATISGYTVSPELLLQVASAHAESGAYQAAYEHTVAAETARNNTRTEEARKRALAMQIRNEVAQAREEVELHRALAAGLRETSATLETLGTIGREITACLDSQAVFEALHRHVHQMLDATFFAVYLLDPQQTALHTAFGIEAGVALPQVMTPIDSATSMFARCVRERQEIAIDRDSGEDDPNRIPGTMVSLSMLYFPLVAGDRVLGAMSIQSPLPRVYQERERSIFRALCAYGVIALDNAAAYGAAAAAQRLADLSLSELRQTQALLLEQNRQLERLAVTDQLTGLYNRLRLDQTLEEERLRNVRYATHFCVLLLDVDKFKSVNDSFGHAVGDQVLVGIAAVLRAGVREVDVLGRWGGEEFMVVCPETSIEGALVLAEKLRIEIHARDFPQIGRKSASFGVAMFRSGETLPETIARADAALYRAKQDGRNRVEFSDG